MTRPSSNRRALAFMVGAALLWPGASAQAQDAGDAVDRTAAQRRDDARSQDRIDQLDEATREALQAYRSAVWETQQLNVYADQLQELIDQQAAELESLREQIRELELTEREIMPLMLRMIDALERFVALDLPFRQEERRKRLEGLRDAMSDPSVSVADRYQKVLEAYAAESDYGRGIGHERAEIDGRVHDILRVGRVALYALSLDGSEVRRWDAASEAWVDMPGHYIPTVRQALRVSREVIAPELLLLPVSVPTADGDAGTLPALDAVEAAPEAAAGSGDDDGEETP